MKKAKKARPHWSRALRRLGACRAAVVWARKQRSLAAAWRKCERADWMFWLIGETTTSEPWSEERKPLVRAALACARLAWSRMPAAGRACIKLHERWCDGGAVDVADLRSAAAAASAAASAYSSSAAASAYSSSAAASSAASAAGATADAASAADAATAADAADAADAAAYAANDGRARVLAECADIVRRHYPRPPKLGRAREGR